MIKITLGNSSANKDPSVLTVVQIYDVCDVGFDRVVDQHPIVPVGVLWQNSFVRHLKTKGILGICDCLFSKR